MLGKVKACIAKERGCGCASVQLLLADGTLLYQGDHLRLSDVAATGKTQQESTQADGRKLGRRPCALPNSLREQGGLGRSAVS